MYEQTHSAYGMGLNSIHRACIHFKSITFDFTSSNKRYDLRLKHSHTTSLASQNMYLVSSKQIILLWASQHFHCTTLLTLTENNSISSTTLSLANLCSHLQQQTIVFSCTRGETHDTLNPKLLSLQSHYLRYFYHYLRYLM
jgi:hypothetical protein